MSALAEALAAAQAKALAALEKAYIRGAIDGDELIESMTAIGLTDTLDQQLLVTTLYTLKEYGQAEPSYNERRTPEKPTDAQRTYIAKLAADREIEPPDLTGCTRAQASEIIESFKAGTYDASKWEVPF